MPVGDEPGDFSDDLAGRSGPQPSAQVRDNAVATERVAAVLDLHERPLMAAEAVNAIERFAKELAG